jgi:hypothetical protein
LPRRSTWTLRPIDLSVASPADEPDIAHRIEPDEIAATIEPRAVKRAPVARGSPRWPRARPLRFTCNSMNHDTQYQNGVDFDFEAPFAGR